MVGFLIGLVWAIYLLVTILLVVAILLQEPRTGGLSTAFGGSGLDTMLGAGIGRKMSMATIVLAVIFMALTIVLHLLSGK
ncbi:MAG: preprotein translocase subunit SecG [Planctomycetota bacterium]|nr:preprotein translocase subunit SecG [Planctomycetota bacterium]